MESKKNPIFYPKFMSLLKQGITKYQLKQDAMSGIVVGIVALPLSIAFAVACGLSPEKGLITAIIAGILISALGGSRVQIGGPTGAFVIVITGVVQQYGVNGLMISTIMAGGFLVLFGLLRMGELLKYFPHSLTVGFTSGIAVLIFSTQIKDALGLEMGAIPPEFIPKWGAYFSNLSTINIYAASITLLTILIAVFSKKILPKVPWSVIAILLMTVGVIVFDIPVTTIETFFGDISTKISFQMPEVELANLGDYVRPALTIALLGGIVSLLSAVVSDGMFGGHHRSNTELIAEGIANIVIPLFGGIPATGAVARTCTNVKNGGRTPIAGIVHSIILLFILLFLGKWTKLIPMSCLAGILIVVSYNMSGWRSFVEVLKGSYFDIVIILSTFILTVFVNLTIAIEVGIVLSAILFMKRMSDISGKTLSQPIDSDVIDDYSGINASIGIYEISGPLFFASAKTYSEIITQLGMNKKIIIIRMRHVSFVDMTGIKNLKGAIELLQQKGCEVLLSGLNESVKADFKKTKLTDTIDESKFFDSFDKALVAAEAKL